ncbi:reverse transcriptase domain-containing protein [Citrus sinensis]|nr:reverse transcriptase domain-containing protein [Citrus sinensis]
MPLHYYHKRVLRILGEVVGRVIRIDYNTEAAKRGKFARVAVEICLNKPLVSQFQLNGKIQRIEYEGLPTICFECGKYGHTTDTCQSKQGVPRGQGCDGVYQPEGEATGVTMDLATVDNPNNSLFGPSMIECTIQGNYNQAQNGNVRSGSRFSLLNAKDNMDNERKINERIPSNHALEISLDLQDENQNSNQPMQHNHRYSLRKHNQRSNRGNVAHPPSPSLVQLRPRPPHANHADQNKLLSPDIHNINPALATLQNQSATTRANQPHLASTSIDPLKHSVYSFANPPDGADMLTQFARANPLFANMTKDNSNNPMGEPPDNGGWNGIGEDEESEGSTYVARCGVDETFKALIQKYNPSMVALFEPRISGKKADEFIFRSGFERSHRIEAEGFSGGIWLMWKDCVKVEVIINHKQFIHFRIANDIGFISWVTAVYASPNKHIRNLLWKDLEAVARNVPGPWLLGGDFNTILHPSERRGGSTRLNGVCQRFSDWFHRNQFCDLEFSGPKFTWERGNLLKRLDRSFCNDEWVQKFVNSQVMHLPKLNSDHRPILVNFERVSRQVSGVKPFRFLASWLTDSRFKTFFFETWRGSGDYVNSAGHFITEVRKWNKEVFGYIHKQKNNILARLAGIQRALEWHRSRNLMDLEMNLKRELESILSQEEILWYKKSRRDWIEFGDRNTKYFHRQTIKRRRQNQIVMLNDEHDNWIEDPGEHIPYPLVSIFPRVDEINIGKLNAGVCEDKIREVIFSMHHFKAPGIDGLYAIFYQTQWDTVGSSIMANRLKGILPDLIGPMQTSFVPGRHIRENIIIAQEIIYTMRRKSGKIGQILIKRLSHRILRAVNTGTWRPIRLSKRGTPITHVFFADDLLLFAEASCNQAAMINDVLNTFCVSSEAKVSKQKSQVFFSKNVKPCNVRNIGTTLGFSMTTDLGNYLGMLVLHSRVSKATYHGILENVERKLNGWSAKHLSLAGRVTLTQTVLQALSIFSMQTTRLPTAIITKLKHQCRRFIWSGNSEVQKIHLINWAEAIGRVWPKVLQGLRWNVRDGKRIRFWQNAWVADVGPFFHLAVAPIPEAILHDWVADAISFDGSWNWSRFGFLLPHNVVLMIAAITPPTPVSKADQFYWGSSNSGMFTARTAFNSILGNFAQDEEVRWKSIWKWRGPHRIRTFLWLTAKERIKCKAELYRRHIGVDMICMRCGYAVEDTAHALRDCVTSRRIWNMLLAGHKSGSFFTLPTRDWMFANIQGMGNHGSNREWSCIFGVAIWCIWVARNQLLFENKVVNAESMVRDIKIRAEEILRTSEAFQSDSGLRVQDMFGWLPPRWPYYKLNSDGARKGSGLAGAGGLIRDATGRWHGGFCMNIGICSVTIAEFWGLYQGLILTWKMGIRLLVVEIDSIYVTQLLNRKSLNATLPLVNDILGLLSREW